MSKEPKKDRVCPKCGGKTMVSDYNQKPEGENFGHIAIRCRACGTWCGGITRKTTRWNNCNRR